MIYLDNAATTYPKPPSVIKAVNNSFGFAANPGRAGHKLSLKASEEIFNCRQRISNMFNYDTPEKVLLMPSCTTALNTVIKGILKKGDHVVISSLEHNSVVRPIQKLADMGLITYSIAQVYECDDDRTVDSFRKKIKDNTRLCVCTHASNVFGVKLPISRICALCHLYNVFFCVDAAQTAGIIDIDISQINADFICAPGHKGLYGPMGTGFLIVNTDYPVDSMIEGGTGSGSSEYVQPDMYPDKFESGTMNLSGFVGLSAGIDFVMNKGIDKIYSHEMNIIRFLYDNLSEIKGVKFYTESPAKDFHVPLISFTVEDVDCDIVSAHLDKNYSIAVRAGLHCSPLAHKSMGTENTGTVRVSPSVFTDIYAVKTFVNAIYKLNKYKKISI